MLAEHSSFDLRTASVCLPPAPTFAPSPRSWDTRTRALRSPSTPTRCPTPRLAPWTWCPPRWPRAARGQTPRAAPAIDRWRATAATTIWSACVFAGRWLVLRPSDARSSCRWTLTRQCAAKACNRLRTWAFTCGFVCGHRAVRWQLDGNPPSVKSTQKQRGTTLCGRPSMPTVAGSNHRVPRRLDNNRRGDSRRHR